MRRSPRILWGVLFAFLAVAVWSPLVAQEESEASRLAKEAEALMQQQQFDAALAKAAEAIEADPSFAGAYWVQGFAYGNMGRHAEARESFLTAAEMNPGWAQAHQMAAMAAFQSGELDLAWEQAIKAQQGGVDMSQGFEMLKQQSAAPDDLDAQLAVGRVFIGPILTERYEEMADRALQGGASGSASARTGVAQRVLTEASQDMYQVQQEARRQINDSRAFALVQRQDMAQILLVIDVDHISDTNPATQSAQNRASGRRRALEGDLKLLDINTGEELYKRRVEFRDIGQRADLNRDFARYMALMEEWAAERAR